MNWFVFSLYSYTNWLWVEFWSFSKGNTYKCVLFIIRKRLLVKFSLCTIFMTGLSSAHIDSVVSFHLYAFFFFNFGMLPQSE